MISIIIPIYNTGDILYRMLESVQKQSYQDFEVILVNDGSTDDSEKICRVFEKEDSRFHYYAQENQGVAAARNNGLQYASGDYIAYLDADDVIDTNYCEALLDACTDADISVCDIVAEVDQKEISRFTMSDCRLTSKQALDRLLMRREINSGPCGKLYRRNVIGDIRTPKLKAYEDILFNAKVFENAQVIGVTDKTQYHYIENSQGAMSSFFKTPSNDIVIATDALMQFIIKHPELDAGCCYITLSHLMQYVYMILEKDLRKGREFLKAAQSVYKKYMPQIVSCPKFPWKEKLLYVMFAWGFLYNKKKVYRLNRILQEEKETDRAVS